MTPTDRTAVLRLLVAARALPSPTEPAAVLHVVRGAAASGIESSNVLHRVLRLAGVPDRAWRAVAAVPEVSP